MFVSDTNSYRVVLDVESLVSTDDTSFISLFLGIHSFTDASKDNRFS